jgi:tRNA(fMet)-specific endonuclease VapC
MFVLDTDLISIMQRRADPEWTRLRNRMEQHERSDFYVTVVSVHEQVLGANNFISRAKKRAETIRGYQIIEWALLTYTDYKTLPYDEPAIIQFENLRQQGVRIGTMDLRIASIALSHDFTLLTRNIVDFEKVPGLRVEDWTIGF